MIYKLEVLPSAKNDLSMISQGYGAIRKSLGLRFLTSFKNEMKLVKRNPTLFQLRYDKTRVVLITKFPYLIHYEIYNQIIIVKAIIHTSREDKKFNI